jgi:F-type H+-transporting ATPase subunit epsilon
MLSKIVAIGRRDTNRWATVTACWAHGDPGWGGSAPGHALESTTNAYEEFRVAKQFHVEVVSVESKVWSGEAESLIARTTEGELAVLAGHAPLLGELKEPSRVRVKVAGRDEVAYDVAGGFLSVTNDGVTVLAESATPAEGPDPAAAAALGTSTSSAGH